MADREQRGHAVNQFDDFQVGDEASFLRSVTEEDVDTFAELSGDKNPLHTDRDYASGTMFDGRLVHGMLTASFVSTALTQLGVGHVYLNQEMKFTHPVYIGDRLTVQARIVEKFPTNRRLKVKTEVRNQEGETVLSGHATLMVMEEASGRSPDG